MGRNALAVFDTEMKQRIEESAALEHDLREALSRNEFVVFYQPQLELASGRLRGYEALVRWERPGQGILSPRDFLALAEETGLIRPIGDWVLRKACEDAASWLDSGTVAVNFSAAQFRSQEIDKAIAKVLQETGLSPERLEIEVPESLFLSDAPDVMETLNRVKALGVRVAMDDFGAGYTGLASLAHFPFDKIKIDRTFVGTADGGRRRRGDRRGNRRARAHAQRRRDGGGSRDKRAGDAAQGGGMQHRAGIPVWRSQAGHDLGAFEERIFRGSEDGEGCGGSESVTA